MMAIRLVEMMVIIVVRLAIEGYGCEDGGVIGCIDGWHG
jgi:hypothetical protein